MRLLHVGTICRRYGVTMRKRTDDEPRNYFGSPPGCAYPYPKRKLIIVYPEFDPDSITVADDVLHELCHLLRGDMTTYDFDDTEGGLMVLQYGIIRACVHREGLISKFEHYGWEESDWDETVTLSRKWRYLQTLWRLTGALDAEGMPTWRWPDFSKLTTQEQLALAEA